VWLLIRYVGTFMVQFCLATSLQWTVNKELTIHVPQFSHWPGITQLKNLQHCDEYLNSVSPSDSLSCRSEVCQNFYIIPANTAACHEQVNLYLILCHRYSKSHRFSSLRNGFGNYALLNVSSWYDLDAAVHQNFDYTLAQSVALAQIREPIALILTQVINIR